jgi:YVTN family beta-propeller protein
MRGLPYDYPVEVIDSPSGDVYLSYGPHQSYWPTVYIWGAKNGVLTINKEDQGFYDRRIPRQAHKMVLDEQGVLYFTQNNWGGEVQFLGTLEDEVRVFQAQKRIALGDTVTREITQRILEYDPELHLLYLVRVGEGEKDLSILQAIDPDSQKVVAKVKLGVTSSDLVFDDENIYVANFESNSISIIDKSNFTTKEVPSAEGPLKLCRCRGRVFVLNHLGNSIQAVKENGKTFELPYEGMPDNLFVWNGKIAITSHSKKALFIVLFDPTDVSFALLHEESYPYGDTRFDTGNVSFYVNGQFGDAVFSITQAKTDKDDRLWVTDFLSGKIFILEDR